MVFFNEYMSFGWLIFLQSISSACTWWFPSAKSLHFLQILKCTFLKNPRVSVFQSLFQQLFQCFWLRQIQGFSSILCPIQYVLHKITKSQVCAHKSSLGKITLITKSWKSRMGGKGLKPFSHTWKNTRPTIYHVNHANFVRGKLYTGSTNVRKC